MYRGTTVRTQFFRKAACSKCQGTGAASPKTLSTCTKCKGKGFTVKRFQNMYGQFQNVEQNCELCKGHGKTINKMCD